MATFLSNTDTQISIYRKVGSGPLIGVRSIYKNSPHPGTNKTIEGWKFDETVWGAEENDNFAQSVPTLWDATTAGVLDYIQSGVGDGDDLLVYEANKVHSNYANLWSPRIEHGYYYLEGKEYYFYSDDGLVDYVTTSGLVASGGNYIQLTRIPKPGIPITTRSYKWDRENIQYIVDTNIPKKVKFTGVSTASGELNTQIADTIFWANVNTANPEFILDYSTNPPTVIFNKDITSLVGKYHVTASGLTSVELSLLDEIGTTSADDNQQYTLTYSPVDPQAPVEIYLDYQGTGVEKWSGVNQLTSGVFNQVKVDRDLGIITFGDSTIGGLPPFGYTVRAAYTKTVGVEYEPDKSRNYIEDVAADLNPIRRFAGNGFVFIRPDIADVTSITLTAELPEISNDVYGPLYLGNNFGRIVATALSDKGEPVEGASLTFELLDVGRGDFGGDETAVSITSELGEASTLYNPPRTIETLGGATDTVTYSGVTSTLFIDDYVPAEGTEDLFLFQVAREDHILGIPSSSLLSFYEDYLNNGELDGPEINWDLGAYGDYGWIEGALSGAIKWEIVHRAVHGLITPVVYDDGDLTTGKKTVIAVNDADAVNPHTGTTPAIVPLQPESFTTTASGTFVNFDYVLPSITVSGLVKSYLVVGPTSARMRAYTFNHRLNTFIYSNTIQVIVDIPPAAKGLYNIDAINSVPSGLLVNYESFDSVTHSGVNIEVSTSGLLPLGFRLYSSGITLASALDGITFLDLNPLSTSANTPIAHSFRVT